MMTLARNLPGASYVAVASPTLFRNSLYVAAALCIIVLLHRLSFLTVDGIVSGTDGGNWLALGHELFGEKVKAASTTYPPIVPLMVKGLSSIFGAFVGVTAVGAVASVLGGIPFFLLVRQSAGALWGLLFTVGFLFLGISIETSAWGGYPQLLAQAFLLFALYWLGRGLIEGRRAFLIGGAVSASLSTWTWTPGALFLLATVPLFVAFVALRDKTPIRSLALRFVGWGALVLLMSLASLPYYLGSDDILQGRTWNPHRYTWGDTDMALQTIFREWPDAVGSVPVMGLVVTLLLGYCLSARARGSLLAPASAAMMISSLVIFFATFEVRTLSLFAIGLIGGVAFVLTDLFKWLKRAPVADGLASAAGVAVAGMALALVAGQVALSHMQSNATFNYYRVLDRDVIDGLDWLRDNKRPGDVVVASGNRHGFQYSWWIEGYSKVPAYSATHPLAFSFEDERLQVAVAHELLRSTSDDEAASIAREHDIRYVFLDKRATDVPEALMGAGFATVFENDSILILGESGDRDAIGGRAVIVPHEAPMLYVRSGVSSAGRRS